MLHEALLQSSVVLKHSNWQRIPQYLEHHARQVCAVAFWAYFAFHKCLASS